MQFDDGNWKLSFKCVGVFVFLLFCSNNLEKSPLHLKGNGGLVSAAQHYPPVNGNVGTGTGNGTGNTAPEKVLSVSGKKKCSHCGEELGKEKYSFFF